jgi:hypothetical protein
MLWSGNECGKSKAMRIKATIPSTYYDKTTTGECGIFQQLG